MLSVRTQIFIIWVVLVPLCLSSVIKKQVENETISHETVDPETLNKETVEHEAPAEHHNGTHETTKRFNLITIDFDRVESPIIIALWLFFACLGKIAFHMTPKLSNALPESCLLILMGLIIGSIFAYTASDQTSPLTADNFFLYFLPPIILDAGYFMPNRLFFDHLGTILMFAVIGTIWNVLTIGISLYAISLTGLFGAIEKFEMLHILLFASLISAVDPVAVLAVFEEIQVEEVLFILVFGESLLNDGVTVVLYHMFEGFSDIGEKNIILTDVISGLVSFLLVALGGTFIGVIWGFLTAFVTRFTHEVSVIEPLFIFTMSYLAYLNAEIFHWSGILAITFCGITMKNYTEENMSENSQTTTKYAMKMLAQSSETVIFLFLGVSTFLGTHHEVNGWFIFLTILFCSVYRPIGVLMFSAVCNRFRVKKIDSVQMFVMSYGGLRGAVAFALAITINRHHIPLAPMFVTTTIAVIFFTVFIQGITIKPLVEKLGVKKSNKIELTMNERLHGRSIDCMMAGMEEITGKLGTLLIRNWFIRINAQYLRPCLVRNAKNEPKLLETLTNLKMQEAIKLAQNPQSTSDLATFSRNYQKFRSSIRNWNLDIGELDYKPAERDLDDAKLHHVLANANSLPSYRRTTYKRHAVKDEDCQQLNPAFKEKMKHKCRQVYMTSLRKKRMKKLTSTPTNPIHKQNGSAVKLSTDYIDNCSRVNEAFDDSEGLFLNSKRNSQLQTTPAKRQSKKGPTLAESILPWKHIKEAERRKSIISRRSSRDTSEESDPVKPMTTAEIRFPWKSYEDEHQSEGFPSLQHEFPPWLKNEKYVDSYSPTNTIIGKEVKKEKRPHMRDLFKKRHTAGNLFAKTKDSTDDLKMRASAKDDIFMHKKSLKYDPTFFQRESVKKFSDINAARAGLSHAEYLQKRMLSARSSTKDSLLNTIIVEEDPSRKNGNGTGTGNTTVTGNENTVATGNGSAAVTGNEDAKKYSKERQEQSQVTSIHPNQLGQSKAIQSNGDVDYPLHSIAVSNNDQNHNRNGIIDYQLYPISVSNNDQTHKRNGVVGYPLYPVTVSNTDQNQSLQSNQYILKNNQQFFLKNEKNPSLNNEENLFLKNNSKDKSLEAAKQASALCYLNSSSEHSNKTNGLPNDEVQNSKSHVVDINNISQRGDYTYL